MEKSTTPKGKTDSTVEADGRQANALAIDGSRDPARVSAPGGGLLRVGAFAFFVAALYVATWVGGTSSHARALYREAKAKYAAMKRAEEAEAKRRKDLDVETKEGATNLRKGGPFTSVEWSVPLLPGVLLVESSERIGRSCTTGGVKLVVHYGFGSAVVVRFQEWMTCAWGRG